MLLLMDASCADVSVMATMIAAGVAIAAGRDDFSGKCITTLRGEEIQTKIFPSRQIGKHGRQGDRRETTDTTTATECVRGGHAASDARTATTQQDGLKGPTSRKIIGPPFHQPQTASASPLPAEPTTLLPSRAADCRHTTPPPSHRHSALPSARPTEHALAALSVAIVAKLAAPGPGGRQRNVDDEAAAATATAAIRRPMISVR